MEIAQNSTLYQRIALKGFSPSHVAEVGVHEPESSNIYKFIMDGVRATLVEPEPEAIAHIKEHFSGRENVTLHECAICDFDGEIELVSNGPSTFVGDLPSSPAMANDGFIPQEGDKFTVPAQRFPHIDDGTIEVLSIDTEGSEWYVIKNLVSRPQVISVETHGAVYVNPFYTEIMQWMEAQGYVVWYKSKTDTVFVLDRTWSRSFAEKVALACTNAKILSRRTRKKLTQRAK